MNCTYCKEFFNFTTYFQNALLMKPIYIFLLLICFSCNTKPKLEPVSAEYEVEISEYSKKLNKGRVNYLKLTGLFKIRDGINTFGKSEDNAITIKAKVDDKIGSISRKDSILELTINKDVKVLTEKKELVYNVTLQLDDIGNSEMFYHNTIYWQVITRSGDLYFRVWDNSNPFVDTFKGFKRYPLNNDFIFKANFEYFKHKKNEEIETQLGTNTTTDFIGRLTFNYKGNEYSLDVGDGGFTMVRDVSSGEKTYGGGRYISLNLPETDGELILDFNKLYNPPCAFSEFTTCPLPPRQNNLAFNIEAGEQYARID